MKGSLNIILLSCILYLASCEKSGVATFENDAVVQAYLAPGQKVTVVISEKIPYDEGSIIEDTAISFLDMHVGYNGQSYSLTPIGKGVYSDTAGVIPLIADSSYSLSFLFDGKQVTSSTIIPLKPTGVVQSSTTIKMSQIDLSNMTGGEMPASVTLMFTNDDESYYIATVESLDTTESTVIKDSVPESNVYSTMPVNGTQVRLETMRMAYFGTNRIILYHINPEYRIFFMQQTSTTQNYQDPPTNIENGLGIFTGLNADTLYLELVQTK
jgi:hypothetical protein